MVSEELSTGYKSVLVAAFASTKPHGHEGIQITVFTKYTQHGRPSSIYIHTHTYTHHVSGWFLNTEHNEHRKEVHQLFKGIQPHSSKLQSSRPIRNAAGQ